MQGIDRVLRVESQDGGRRRCRPRSDHRCASCSRFVPGTLYARPWYAATCTCTYTVHFPRRVISCFASSSIIPRAMRALRSTSPYRRPHQHGDASCSPWPSLTLKDPYLVQWFPRITERRLLSVVLPSGNSNAGAACMTRTTRSWNTAKCRRGRASPATCLDGDEALLSRPPLVATHTHVHPRGSATSDCIEMRQVRHRRWICSID